MVMKSGVRAPASTHELQEIFTVSTERSRRQRQITANTGEYENLTAFRKLICGVFVTGEHSVYPHRSHEHLRDQ